MCGRGGLTLAQGAARRSPAAVELPVTSATPSMRSASPKATPEEDTSPQATPATQDAEQSPEDIVPNADVATIATMITAVTTDAEDVKDADATQSPEDVHLITRILAPCRFRTTLRLAAPPSTTTNRSLFAQRSAG